MAAAAQQVSSVIEFEPNKAVECRLKFPTGKFVKDGTRVMFTLMDGRVMFFDRGPAEKINQLRVKPGEPFFVQLNWSGKRSDRKEWTAWLSIDAELRRAKGEAEEIGDAVSARQFGRTVERREEAIAKLPVVGAAPARGIHPEPNPRQGWAQFLLSETNALTEVYVAARAYGEGKGVPPEVVERLLERAFANRAKGGPDVA